MIRWACWLFSICCVATVSAQTRLSYVPAPPDNPLKGLVPYAQPHPGRFPHSMEFNYLPLSDLMVGPDEFNWQPLEALLDDIASRRHQTIFRIWMEYPGHDDGIPPFLEQSGMKVTEWLNTNTAPFPPKQNRTPDYSDPRLHAALRSFIKALGAKYDGDPRIGYITAGLLGTWGEWHTYPRVELMADKKVQAEVMDAYEQAFTQTPVLLRYPAGDDTWGKAANHRRPLGYHDDSFAWATLDTGREQDNWYFMPALQEAGPAALEKWKTQPIGGEIRPELWGQIFDQQPEHSQAQDFATCVKQTHATWLMDSGMFRRQQSPQRIENAIGQVQRMGYEFYIESVQSQQSDAGDVTLSLQVRNTGIAPFYHDWQIEIGVIEDDAVTKTIAVDWSLQGLLPGEPARVWQVTLPASERPKGPSKLAVRVINPLPGGLPLRFANQYSGDQDAGWFQLP